MPRCLSSVTGLAACGIVDRADEHVEHAVARRQVAELRAVGAEPGRGLVGIAEQHLARDQLRAGRRPRVASAAEPAALRGWRVVRRVGRWKHRGSAGAVRHRLVQRDRRGRHFFRYGAGVLVPQPITRRDQTRSQERSKRWIVRMSAVLKGIDSEQSRAWSAFRISVRAQFAKRAIAECIEKNCLHGHSRQSFGRLHACGLEMLRRTLIAADPAAASICRVEDAA